MEDKSIPVDPFNQTDTYAEFLLPHDCDCISCLKVTIAEKDIIENSIHLSDIQLKIGSEQYASFFPDILDKLGQRSVIENVDDNSRISEYTLLVQIPLKALQFTNIKVKVVYAPISTSSIHFLCTINGSFDRVCTDSCIFIPHMIRMVDNGRGRSEYGITTAYGLRMCEGVFVQGDVESIANIHIVSNTSIADMPGFPMFNTYDGASAIRIRPDTIEMPFKDIPFSREGTIAIKRKCSDCDDAEDIAPFQLTAKMVLIMRIFEGRILEVPWRPYI